jgi:hypothetical protein
MLAGTGRLQAPITWIAVSAANVALDSATAATVTAKSGNLMWHPSGKRLKRG